jgi:hypothetical protein
MDQPVALRPGEVPLQWHEAAAVVQLIADHVADGSLHDVPPIEWLAVDADGAVHVLESSTPVSHRPSANQASALRQLFKELVGSNPVPDAVLPAIQLARDGSEIESAAAFSDAIRFFVRPSCVKDLQGLAVRLRSTDEASQLQHELEELTRKARVHQAVTTEQKPADAPEATRRPKGRKRKLIAVAASGVLLPVTVMLFAPIGGKHNVSAGSVLVEQGKRFVQDMRDGARSMLGDTTKAAPKEASSSTDDAAPSGALTRRPRISAARKAEARGAVAISLDPPPVASIAWILSEPVAPTAPALIEVPPLTTIEGGGRLYDSEDEEVAPATLVRPRLPARSAADKRLGALEVIIAASGEVERVRLLSTSAEHRYYNAMLLPAVKAWVFSPAVRDGIPVRYRLEIPLTH